MTKSELKKVLKPLILEVLKEAVLEQTGFLSSILREVKIASLPNVQTAMTHEPLQRANIVQSQPLPLKNPKIAIEESKKQLLKSIGTSAYGGVNVFEGIDAPIPEEKKLTPSSTAAASPLANIDPNDPGVNIDGILQFSNMWKKIAKVEK